MTRKHSAARNLIRRLRPSPERLAAAAALQDPSLLMQLQATQEHGERPPRRRRAIPAAIRGETGGALLLVAAIVLALVWSNSPWQASYAAFWHAPVALTVGQWTLGADLRTWIDEGLMTLFFLGVGLEAKRERDLGALREGRRLTVPVLAGLAGMSVSALVYLALTAGGAGAGGWGVAISTDTALALGALTITGGRRAHRLQHRLHPWTSKVVVPIFALANAGLHVDGHVLASAASSAVTWGIVLAYLVGKPLGILLASSVASHRVSLSRGELRGTALSAGIGFTVSLLIASRAFDGALLDQAKVGILATALLAPALAAAALAPLRRRVGDSTVRRGSRVGATLPCAA